MSCGAACARQILLDVGIDIPESRIRDLAGFDPTLGISSESLKGVLNELHPGACYEGGTIFPEYLNSLASKAPFLVMLRMPFGRHMVIVDKIADELVYIRDPWGIPEADSTIGMEGIMELSSFHERWQRTVNKAVYRR